MRRKRWVLNLIVLALIGGWVALLSLLTRRERAPCESVMTFAQSTSWEGKEEWMGVYLGEKKVGWVMSRTHELEDGYRIVEKSSLTLRAMGTEQTVRSLVECSADTNYALRSLWFSFRSGEHVLKLRGEVEGESFRYELDSGGETVRSEVPLPEEVYIPVSVEAIASRMGLEAGKVDSFQIFEPTTSSLTQVKVAVHGQEEISLRGQQHKATKIVVSFLGTRSTIWLDEDGSVLKQESPLGLTMVRETREEATREQTPSERVEIFTDFAVQSNVDIQNPRSVSLLRLRLIGSDFGGLEIEDERQRLVHDTLSIWASARSLNNEAELDREGFRDDLTPSHLVQSDDRRITALVDSVVRPEDPLWTKASKLLVWVYQNVEKRPTMSIPSAVEVLEHREGDCNEHAILFTALARACGIPARICAGLVYTEGGFYYHAWSKVWVGEWVAVDPTFGQPVADATHIKLVEGGMEDLLDIVAVVGNLKVDVLEYR